jgi:biopolymer transport protein ExbD
MFRRRRKDPVEKAGETQLLPVMNIMLLMIPALLLAMEVARLSAIAVVPPRVGPAEKGEPPTTPDMPLRVFVAEDGFMLAVGEAPAELIPLADATAPAGQPASYDFAALEARARTIKGAHPTGGLHLDAEGSIPLQTVVATLDALRGSSCRLARLAPGEAPGPECVYTDVTVAPGTRLSASQNG